MDADVARAGAGGGRRAGCRAGVEFRSEGRQGGLLLGVEQGEPAAVCEIRLRRNEKDRRRAARCRCASPGRPTSIFPGSSRLSIRSARRNPPGFRSLGAGTPRSPSPSRKCIAEGVPTVVDDGDLPNSGRLAYIGTDWTAIGQAQAKKMMEALPNGGKIAMTSIINANNMREGVAGFTAYIKAQRRRQISDRRQRGRQRRRLQGGAGDVSAAGRSS